jgi:molecular chaperone GrpE
MPKQETESTVEPIEKTPRGAGVKIDPAAELPPPDDDGLASAGVPEPGEEVAAAAAGPTEVEQLRAERDQLLDRLARQQAEFENARKRAERERIENREYVTANVVGQFLPVLDSFDLALKSDSSAKQLRAGVELIVKQMEEILNKMQVSAVPAVGEAFDPRIHEAMGTVESEDIPDQHVAEEVRRGYRLRDRLIRPALVRVAHNAKQKSE